MKVGIRTWARAFVRGNRTDTLALLADLNAGGQTLVLVTHNPDLAARYTHRMVTLADGRVTVGSQGTARDGALS